MFTLVPPRPRGWLPPAVPTIARREKHQVQDSVRCTAYLVEPNFEIHYVDCKPMFTLVPPRPRGWLPLAVPTIARREKVSLKEALAKASADGHAKAAEIERRGAEVSK